MIAIVESRADEASVNICEQLRTVTDWERHEDRNRPDADGGGPYYRRDGFELRSFDALHLELDRAAEAFDERPAFLVFASRHSGGTGPLLTGHFTGNFGPAEYGGADRSVAEAAPNVLPALLEAFDEFAPDGYDVGMECTHHGPTDVGCPSLFVELGSDEAQWADEEAAEAVARAILALDGVEPNRTIPSAADAGLSGTTDAPARHLVGFGGGHYVPRFERIVRETPWAVGHVAPEWALETLEDPATETDLLCEAFEASAAAFAVVEGEHPDLTDAIDALGYRVVSESWIREVGDRSQSLVEAVETALGPIAEGVRFGERRSSSFEVVTLPTDLIEACEGIDPDRSWDIVTAEAVAVETTNGGTRLGERIAVPEDAGPTAPSGLPRRVVDGLAGVLRDGFDQVRVADDVIEVETAAFDPDLASDLGIPDGPAFGALAGGESVTVDGTEIDPEAVHVTRTDRFPL
ncbi:D-aminoacyl-tRNA deacylase [Halovivax gelatinilyticus]|uniref:D-aminoacyl-tRNA deacylase n=1 Tax=Halovivax gelatinilyticus TaxID=2961597 RepID=UPI0020CA6FE8|nr:D-aminoacyl-tRNA deacylase [Halovivax gelatinilyticus]